MKKIIKGFLSLTTILFIFTGGFVSAQETLGAQEEVSLDESVDPADLNVESPGVLPDNPFYFLKNWSRSIMSFFTFDPLKKAELSFKFDSELLMEIKKMAEENKDSEAINNATERYQEQIENTRELAEKIKEKAESNNETEEFLDKFIQQEILHQRVLGKLQEQVPAESSEKIEEARNDHLERFKDVILKLEDKESLPDRLEENLEKLEGGSFKDFKSLELLNDLKEKLPEDLSEKIEEKKEVLLESLYQKLESLPPEEQEKFKEYIDQISGDKINHLNIISSLEGKELSGTLKMTVETIKERSIKSIEERVKETISGENLEEKIRETEELLEKAKLSILSQSTSKEEMPAAYRLINEAEEKIDFAKKALAENEPAKAFAELTASSALSRNASIIIVTRAGFEESVEGGSLTCTDRKAPVCGENGTTYLNICEAKKIGTNVVYRGECQPELGCRGEGERINKNPILGSINQVCCNGLEEIRIDSAYSVCKKPGTSFECRTDRDCPLSRCARVESKCVDGKCVIPQCIAPQACIQVISPATNPVDGVCKEFPTPCDVPAGWTKVHSCLDSELKMTPSLELKLEEFKERLGPILNLETESGSTVELRAEPTATDQQIIEMKKILDKDSVNSPSLSQ